MRAVRVTCWQTAQARCGRGWHAAAALSAGAFLVMDAALAAARAAGRSITNLSVGSSDLPPPQEALDALAASIQVSRWARPRQLPTTNP